MALDSMQEIFDKIQEGQKPFWKVVRDTDVEERQVTAEASFEKMRITWQAMLESVDTYRARSPFSSAAWWGETVSGCAELCRLRQGPGGDYLSRSSPRPCARRSPTPVCDKIVAAPTAGACGVLPAVLVPLYRRGVPEEEIVQATVRGGGYRCGYRISGLHLPAPPADARRRLARRLPWRRER